jgi:hypothetical protein
LSQWRLIWSFGDLAGTVRRNHWELYLKGEIKGTWLDVMQGIRGGGCDASFGGYGPRLEGVQLASISGRWNLSFSPGEGYEECVSDL